VWDGEDPGCAHEWGAETVKVSTPHAGLPFAGAHSPEAMIRTFEQRAFSASHGAFCARCNAWRGALGLEPDPALYVAHLVEVFRAVRRVLRADGTCWVNLGDSYVSNFPRGVQRDSSWWSTKSGEKEGVSIFDLEAAFPGNSDPRRTGLKVKDLIGIPWRVAFALQADGWWLRSEIIWHKPNPMPESVTDRPTKAHESLFLLAKAERYFFDAEAIREPQSDLTLERFASGNQRTMGHKALLRDKRDCLATYETSTAILPNGRQKRSVWTIPSAPFSEAHFATFPPALVEPCLQAGTSARGACPACGAPWRREVERLAQPSEDWHFKPGDDPVGRIRPRGKNGDTHAAWKALHPDTTLGWAPTCACAPTPVPCVVLDPFAGAGTVGLVADRLGRDAILIDLSPTYAAMAERRIREEAPLLTAVAVEAAAPPATGNGHGRAAPEQLGLDWSDIAVELMGEI
jgi:DNA modification methylase